MLRLSVARFHLSKLQPDWICAPCWYPLFLCLLVALKNLVVLYIVVIDAVSSTERCWRLQTEHYFYWGVWHMSRTSSWRMYGLRKRFNPLYPFSPIRSYHLSWSSWWLKFQRRLVWTYLCQHMEPSIWVIYISSSSWETKNIPSCSCPSSMAWWTRIRVSIFVVVKIEAYAILEERDNLDGLLFFVADNIIKNWYSEMAIDCTGDEVPHCAICSQELPIIIEWTLIYWYLHRWWLLIQPWWQFCYMGLGCLCWKMPMCCH